MSEAPVNLPVFNIRCGQPAGFALQWLNDDATPIDLTTWTARFAIAQDLDGFAIVDLPNASISKTATGDVALLLSESDTASLQPYLCGCLWFQLDLVNSTADMSARFQGRVKAFARIEP